MDTRLAIMLILIAVLTIVSLYQLATGKKTAKEIGTEVMYGFRGHQGEVPSHLRPDGQVQGKSRLDTDDPFAQRVLQNLRSADQAMVTKLVGPGGRRRFVHGLLQGEPEPWLATVELSPEERLAVLGGDDDPARLEPTGLMELFREEHEFDIGGYSEVELQAVSLHLTMKKHFEAGQ